MEFVSVEQGNSIMLKRNTSRWLVFLFGGDTQTRTGGGAFAELCLTTWLCRHMDNRSNCLLLLSFAGAGDEARTRYLHLGKVALYQMSYTCKSQYMLC